MVHGNHPTTTISPTSSTRLAASRARRRYRVARSSLAWVEPLRQLDPEEADDTFFADRDEINGLAL